LIAVFSGEFLERGGLLVSCHAEFISASPGRDPESELGLMDSRSRMTNREQNAGLKGCMSKD
jgi:hypothetical protein